jgi:uncharacterized protein YuzE
MNENCRWFSLIEVSYRHADRDGNIGGITIEHASERADIPKFSYEQITA